MVDNSNERKYPRLALPVGKIKIPKFLYVSLIILAILVFLVSGLYFYLEKSKENSKVSLINKTGGKSSFDYVEAIPSGSLKPKVLNSATGSSNLEIAKKVLNWIDSKKNSDGVYSIGCECVNQTCEKCSDEIYIPRNIPFALWGQFKYAEKNDDYKDLIAEIDLFQKNLKDHSLQYGGWNCKLLYEIWQSSKLSQNVKDQIKNICVRSEYEFEDGLTMPNDIDVVILSKINDLSNNLSFVKNDEENNSENLYKYSELASEMVTRVLWKPLSITYTFDNFSETELAKMYFNKALISFSLKEKSEIKDNAILGIAAIDLYKLTKDESYLNFSKYLLNLKSELGQDVPYSLIYQALLANDLAIVTQDQSFKLIGEETILNIVKNNDESFYQIGAFKAPSDAYYLKENSLIVGLLSDT
ncbi:MAG: hypothetical protein PHC62_10570 [Candidatus Izemoplasmatales bacterium]|nr:hypothetical protein [Candidatus Izemoplasmatales bacterium]